jgi:PKD repeat protein
LLDLNKLGRATTSFQRFFQPLHNFGDIVWYIQPKKAMKRTGIIVVATAIIFLSHFAPLIAQCNASFVFTVGANGAATLASTSTGTTANTNYTWLFPMAHYYNWSPAMTHTFTDNGIHTVTLQISDTTVNPVCGATFTANVQVTTAPCYTSSFLSWFQLANGTVSFMFFAGNNPTNGYTHSWSFGDGGTSSAANPVHTYSAGGVYNVTATAVGYSAICTYTAAESITVVVASCTNYAAGFTFTVGTANSVTFQVNNTPGITSAAYTWDFADGSQTMGTSSPTIAHTFTANGTYSVKHSGQVKYGQWFGCHDSIIHPVSLPNSTCNAATTFTLLKDPNVALKWWALATYPLNATAAMWTWGDGNQTGGYFPSHSYSTAGSYNICVNTALNCGYVQSVCSLSSIFKSSAAQGPDMIEVNVIDAASSTVGIEALRHDELGVRIFPNPSDGEIEVITAGQARTVYITVVNLLGVTVHSESYEMAGSPHMQRVNLTELGAGTYFLQFDGEGTRDVHKLVIAP